MRPQIRGIAAGLSAASIWGGMYVVSDVVLETIPPFTLLGLRLALGILTWGIVIVARRLPVPFGRLREILFAGFVGYGVSLGLQFVGTKLSTAANGALLTSATPAFVALFAAWLLREKLSRRMIFALLVSTAGVLLVVDVRAARFSPDLFLGNLALVGAALTWGLYSVLMRRATLAGENLVPLTFIVLFGGLPISLPLMGLELAEGNIGIMTPQVILGVLYLGVISTAFAMYLWTYAFARLEANAASLTFFAQPVVGVALSAILLGEVISPAFYAGGLLIGTGLWLSARKEA